MMNAGNYKTINQQLISAANIKAAFVSWLSKRKISAEESSDYITCLEFISQYCVQKYQIGSIFSYYCGAEIDKLKKRLTNDEKFRILNKERGNSLFMALDKYHSFVCKSVKEYKKRAVRLESKGLSISSEGLIHKNKSFSNPDFESGYVSEGSVQNLDFSHPELCAGCDPVKCVVEGELIEGRAWRSLFITLLEKYLANKRGRVEELFYSNLLPGSKRPTILRNKPVGSCRQLSNGYWVYMNFSIPTIIMLIGRLCTKCGVDISDVYITYQRKQNKKVCIEESANTVSFLPDRVLQVIRTDYTNGFAFSSTSLRLLSVKTGCEITEKMQEQLKRLLFMRNDKVYFFIETVALKKDRDYILQQANRALDLNGFFDINELYKLNISKFNAAVIRELIDFEDFYSFIDNNNTRCVGQKSFRIARLRCKNINELFTAAANKAYKIAHLECGGMITIDDLLAAFPLCSTELADYILNAYSEKLIKAKINDITCFQTIDSLGLTDDFSQQLTEIIDNLDKLEIPVSDSILHAVLSTKMDVNFKKEYGILDDRVFRRIISFYYKASPCREWKNRLFTEVTN